MNRRAIISSVIAIFVPLAASAHAPLSGVGDFYNGVAHPVLTPTHVLVLIVVGLVIGQAGMRRLVWLGYVIVGFVLGLMMTSWLVTPASISLVIVATGLLCALVVVSAWQLPAIPAGFLMMVTGCLIGFDSGVSDPGIQYPVVIYLGMLLSIVVVVFDIAWLVTQARTPWQFVLVRIIGSWIVAAAVIYGVFLFV